MDDAAVLGSHDRRARAAGYGVFFVTGLCFATLVTRIPALQERFGLSEGELTVLLALVPIVAGIGSIAAGALAPRTGSAALLRVLQPAMALAIVAVGFAPTLALLFLCNFLVGLCLGAVDAAMNMQAVGVERRYGVSVLTGFHAVWSVGAILGSLWAGFSAVREIPLGPAFAAAAVLGITVSLLAGPFLYRHAKAHPAAPSPAAPGGTATSSPPATRTAVAWRPILLVGTALAIVYVADSAVSTWSAVFMENVLSSVALAPLAYGCYQVSTVIGRGGGDFAIRRYGAPAVVRFGSAAAVLGLLAVVLAQSPWTALAGFALTGLGTSVVIPTSFSAAGKIDPDGTGVAVARVNIFNYVGFVAGAILIGGIAEALDLRAAFAAPLLLVLVVIALARSFDPAPAEAGAVRSGRAPR